eukprot:TRINITY_DN7622_c0_g1_i1.p1 TRINITY_DN7622_c0_g1~~TRINITY_DN7622_c0_g1_i1.p1  ORF type:complete len:121 (+),score=5.64 TRINITY_DN7622_c0_g1_i1:376-738(+)
MDCEKEGYLTKMGQVAKNWKLRYFVLRDGILCYYKTQTHAQTSGKPLGLLYLGACTRCGPCGPSTKPANAVSDFCLYIQCPPKKRTYYVCALSQGELDEWQQAVSKYLNGVGPTGPARQS